MSVNIRKRDGYAASMPAEILAADDDEDIREMIDVSLSEEFDVETVKDGLEAWEYLEESPDSLPKAVILDVMMPEMDGFSVLDHIRENDGMQDIQVIMLTSRSREEDIVRALEAGADDFLAKPFNKSELYGRVQQTLQ
ncbi:response regulator transcription factor [Salarchaeum japonicum]|jgi:DNA-binding response OmpR family regulator|uniref:response regulator transcription factor n=1 Tax=Salarchaeum japonicum TaxID=555573 RepID=UPI003C759800